MFTLKPIGVTLKKPVSPVKHWTYMKRYNTVFSVFEECQLIQFNFNLNFNGAGKKTNIKLALVLAHNKRISPVFYCD